MATMFSTDDSISSPTAAGVAGSNDGDAVKHRPCDACRKRKTRCLVTEEASACVLCKSRSQHCTFLQDPPPKRKRSEMENSGNRLTASGGQGRTASNLNTKQPVNDYSSLSGPSLLKQTLGHQNRRSTSYVGNTTEYDPQLLDLLPFNSKQECLSGYGELRRSGQSATATQSHFIVCSDSLAEVKEEVARLDAIEAIVTPHGPALVDLYYRIVHPSFPILHKKVFLEKHHRTYRELTPLGLAAVYILALNWWSYSQELSRFPKPKVGDLEKLIPKMLAECYLRPKISDLQGALVLLQRPSGDSWSLTGQLVAMAQTLGIHLDCSDWEIPSWERGVRKRVAWALFAQDKWGSLIYGRPSHITNDNWDVRPLDVDDFPETSKDDNDKEGSAEVEKGRLIFCQLISLTEILSDVLKTFFSLRALRHTNTTIEALEKAKPLQINLKSWYTSLPASLSMEETTARKLSSTGYLHLCYLVTEITLHRAIIRSQDLESSENIRQIIRSAAKTRLVAAVDFVKRIKPEHLQSFWYFPSKHNLAIIGTFGSVLLATTFDNDENESQFYKSQLADYQWTLKISSPGADFMSHSMKTLDASMALVNDFGLQTTPGPSSKGPAIDEKSVAHGDRFPNSLVDSHSSHYDTEQLLTYSPNSQQGISWDFGPGFADDANLLWEDLDSSKASRPEDAVYGSQSLGNAPQDAMQQSAKTQINGHTQAHTMYHEYNKDNNDYHLG